MAVRSYEDIIEMQRPTAKRRGMEIAHRAKIFAPFAALKGFEDCVREKEIIFEERKILTDDQIEKIDQRLRSLKDDDRITAEYFVVHPLDTAIGQYKKIMGPICFEKDPNIIRIQDKRILICDLVDITGDMFD